MALIWRSQREPTEDMADASVGSSMSGLTAASATIPPERWGKVTKPQAGGDGGKWQEECWNYLEDIGELSFALLWKTALLSRFRLVASDIDPETGIPTGSTENAAAKAIVAQIAGGATGQSQMLARLAPLMMIPGEGWLAIIYPGGGTEEEWHILSRDEIKTQAGGRVELLLADGSKYVMQDETDTLARIWRPDPRRSWLAWSPVKAARPILKRIQRMEAVVDGAGKSRQAGNGILVLPREISMPTAPAPRGAPADPDDPPPPPPPPAQFVSASDVRRALQEAMSTAISDPSSAEALVPIILTVAGEYVDKIKHIRFDSEVSEKALDAQDKAVRRLAMTLDMPADVLLGLADLNHWSLWGVEEEAVRWHAAPEMEVICDAFTRDLLRPQLEKTGTAGNVVVWYDTSDVDTQPDQIDKVQRAYTDGVVNADAYMRQLGMGDSDGYDLTTTEGWTAWVTDQVRRDATLVPLLAPVLRALVPALRTLPELPSVAPRTTNEPAAVEPPSRGTPDTRNNAAASAVVRMCVNQALRLAGKRRDSRAGHARVRGATPVEYHLQQYLGPCQPAEVDKLIEGWADIVDDEVCAGAGIGVDQLREVVHATVRTALTMGTRPVLPGDRP